MRKATRVTASVLGLTAGVAGVEHGVFEILQGNIRPAGLMMPSIGPPCVPELSWSQCEPAMTVIPSFLITGILAVILGATVVVWSGFFVQRKRGGLILILLSIPLLLFGGGIFPPIIAIIAGALGTRIHKPLDPDGSRLPGGLVRFLAGLWSTSLVLYALWVFGQWIVGHFFNDWLLANGYIIIVMVLGTLLLVIVSTYARDLSRSMATGAKEVSPISPGS
jgi:hypothetical protein